MAGLGELFAWRDALVIVKPDTFVRWHRDAFRLFWRWKSRPSGRPALPKNIRALIRKMDREKPTWGEERIADELMLKLLIRVSPRTVAKYRDMDRPRGVSNQRWKAFIQNHAKAIVACDFFISLTATFRVLYVFVAMEMAPDEFFISTLHRIQRLNGQFNNSVSSSPSIIRPVRSPRPGFHIFHRTRRGVGEHGGSGSENAGSHAEGERVLRKTDRHAPPGVS
jgi:hypothetical protein